ncbi:MAG: hypothetical protein DGJ47_000001, partial [Rickettsiaceae bacterium]
LKVKCFIASFFPSKYYHKICKKHNADDTAVILFTSGTEGAPKAVALSHSNIQANRHQILSRIDFNINDCAFNALPMFHSFGLNATLIMALSGVKTFFYPSPLHYRVIPEVIYDINATIMFSTDTFLNGYANSAHPYDFYSLRYIIAGAEKLKSKTRETWAQKFGIRVFEGYGVTETSPVLSFNTPMHNKPGTVGRLLPNIEHFLQPVEGISDGGRLCVKGPNIMQGYIKQDNPGVIIPTSVRELGAGWYDTGDIVRVDDEGFIEILGRQKRFSKIGGEMISLTLVEQVFLNADMHSTHAAICINDNKKGEQIVVFTTNKDLTRTIIMDTVRKMQLSELYIPKNIQYIAEIPVLATGKVDYKSLRSMVN